jgi:hypothetical protein
VAEQPGQVRGQDDLRLPALDPLDGGAEDGAPGQVVTAGDVALAIAGPDLFVSS